MTETEISLPDRMKALLARMETMTGKSSAADKSRALADAAVIMADVTALGDAPPELFAVVGPEVRMAAFQIVMGIVAQSLGE